MAKTEKYKSQLWRGMNDKETEVTRRIGVESAEAENVEEKESELYPLFVVRTAKWDRGERQWNKERERGTNGYKKEGFSRGNIQMRDREKKREQKACLLLHHPFQPSTTKHKQWYKNT